MKKRLSVLAAAAVGVACLVAPTAAHADEADQCWYNVETGESACFTTFAEVVADLSGGQVAVAGGASSFSSSQAAAVGAATALASVPIGTEYEDASYGGASITYTASGSCDSSTSSVEYSVANVGSTWNDQISSFHSFNGCRTKLWSNVSFGGTGYGFYGDKASIGTMNDEASSIQWT